MNICSVKWPHSAWFYLYESCKRWTLDLAVVGTGKSAKYEKCINPAYTPTRQADSHLTSHHIAKMEDISVSLEIQMLFDVFLCIIHGRECTLDACVLRFPL